jgi:hypothetical protein
MVDNVLLEKRNRYLGKLIRKTQNLTESVKLLSTIDKEIFSQSGGATLDQVATTWVAAFNNAYQPSISSTSEIKDLENAIKELEKVSAFYIKDGPNNMASMLNGHMPVIFKKLEGMGVNITELIDKLKAVNAVFDEFELKRASELLLEIQVPANAYIEAIKAYKAYKESLQPPTSQTPSKVTKEVTVTPKTSASPMGKLKTNVRSAYNTLQDIIGKQAGKQSYDLFLKMTRLLYPEPQLD